MSFRANLVPGAVFVTLIIASHAHAVAMESVLKCAVNGKKVSIQTDATKKIRIQVEFAEKLGGAIAVTSHRTASAELTGKITKLFDEKSSLYQVTTSQGVFDLQVSYEIDDNGAEQMVVAFFTETEGVEMAPYFKALGLPDYGTESFYQKGECKGLMAERLDGNWHWYGLKEKK